MSTVAVVVREDVDTDTTTVERVYGDTLRRKGKDRALEYVLTQRAVYPGVEFHIEEMPVY